MKVWCVEDDTSIRDNEVYTHESTGFEAKGFPDGASFFAALGNDIPDLVILDSMLPGEEDGVTMLERLKASTAYRTIPVIMETAKGMEYDKIQSLDMGADDYLVKPFGMMEMVSRVKAVLRRCRAAPAERVLKAGGLSVNLDEHTVFADGERVRLTYKEYELLKLFLSHRGMVFTRDRLFSVIWGEDYLGETRTVDMHIRTLRQKLGIYGEMIETVRNVGYRMDEMEVTDKNDKTDF